MARRGLEALSRVPVFSKLSKRHQRHVLGLADEEEFARGATLAVEGQPGDVAYVLLEGQVRVSRRNRKVATLLPGDFFGEISLLDGGPRTASVVAETPVVCLSISRRDFRSLLEREPGVAAGVLQELAARLRQSQRPLTG
jgi:CRP/FNR family transcriptional regulator, cyclic AMP receptor protein